MVLALVGGLVRGEGCANTLMFKNHCAQVQSKEKAKPEEVFFKILSGKLEKNCTYHIMAPSVTLVWKQLFCCMEVWTHINDQGR